MNVFDFNQRVHLRRDPAQWGHIGRGPFAELASKSSKAIYQFVFWEHEGSDVVTCENIADLMGEEEYHERRALFMNVMRKPEMNLVRAALHQLKWDETPDWRAISEMELFRYGYRNECCMVLCGVFMLVCLDVNAAIPHFILIWSHDEENPACKCEFCETERQIA